MSLIIDTIRSHAVKQPAEAAILGVEGSVCTYHQLLIQVENTINTFRALGIGQNDSVAIVLPNGLLMATAFISIAAGMASSPLNPNYTAAEYDFFLRDLGPKTVVVEFGSNNPVLEVAKKLHIPITFIKPISETQVALFEIFSEINPLKDVSNTDLKPSDIALILHTSGTTSRPKMVPLTQKNLVTSAQNICNTLHLSADDCCLNVMPLFHIHGLIAAVLASITAGGSVVCTPGFYAPRFFEWLGKFKPTWYTAVPTIHQSIMNRVDDYQPIVNQTMLRFIRSSSSSLPPSLMEKVEATFGVPIIEAYGMTEASHQIASNPLPPNIRKPGSVGLETGSEIAIMDVEHPTLLPSKEYGEIVIRGENVTLGYMNNPQANQDSFSKGWFRTGDQGFIDEDGYLFITGRLKEIINRGGEKISPREVDEILLKHSEISQAVTFGFPDELLGEDIAAAIVLKDKSVNVIEIKQHVATHLAPHKVPNRIFIVNEIPKGPTGKLQRIGLAEKFGLKNEKIPEQRAIVIYQAPQTEIEHVISKIWHKNLDKEKIGVNDQFRDSGGDSMIATLIHTEVEAHFRISIDLVEFFAAATISAQAKLVESSFNE